MSLKKWFKLIDKHFSEIDKEWQWTYLLLIPLIFNEQIIHKITITDHYQLEHGDIIINEKILEVIRKLNGAIMKPEPKKKSTWPEVFVPKGIEYGDKKYLLVFWFERNSSDWLWVRDCYPS
ncbi:MAG: hypothetical protein I3273_01530 [Candidatus Moeniiplasma glomeromycotorum]|nr:hypothetical protein [Candidatus Moeniiplasma glomeromycotorum]MCE8167197.1 hypothetical protein [Candidatus Moeniiplasma glomeromycotorum]MCE8168791.1 hypothetical protein [Candidatus Moeniiplasma glomeromycotorum]